MCHDTSSVNFLIHVDAQALALLFSSPFLISSHVPLTTSFPYKTHYVIQARTGTMLKFSPGLWYWSHGLDLYGDVTRSLTGTVVKELLISLLVAATPCIYFAFLSFIRYGVFNVCLYIKCRTPISWWFAQKLRMFGSYSLSITNYLLLCLSSNVMHARPGWLGCPGN